MKFASLDHAKSVNLARRWSIQNEPDMVMEDLYDDEMAIKKKAYSRQECATLATHLERFSQLPSQCVKFKEIASDLRRRDSDTTHGSQVLS
mmetsp:Transcript_23498/g.65369  ORF Transcript_23498/g.65369 Transcript_23498/m.65369 type:complete len:91 (+) Transcript_23498:75-347(+)|eukprot:CAMPEP_0168741490 /NCGR_PEP_ID=MMETSP0724-20121128/12543_1 /TAXON_ID=265536 /ORGANISM="Amphiprora sp., Strain CCMP467" /LENGTH=90 /DNA_ID=CAMNT_0008789001 /DNA_START=45 /DNA_END=317 /DNA_ORIENTATION=+